MKLRYLFVFLLILTSSFIGAAHATVDTPYGVSNQWVSFRWTDYGYQQQQPNQILKRWGKYKLALAKRLVTELENSGVDLDKIKKLNKGKPTGYGRKFTKEFIAHLSDSDTPIKTFFENNPEWTNYEFIAGKTNYRETLVNQTNMTVELRFEGSRLSLIGYTNSDSFTIHPPHLDYNFESNLPFSVSGSLTGNKFAFLVGNHIYTADIKTKKLTDHQWIRRRTFTVNDEIWESGISFKSILLNDRYLLAFFVYGAGQKEELAVFDLINKETEIQKIDKPSKIRTQWELKSLDDELIMLFPNNFR